MVSVRIGEGRAGVVVQGGCAPASLGRHEWKYLLTNWRSSKRCFVNPQRECLGKAMDLDGHGPECPQRIAMPRH